VRQKQADHDEKGCNDRLGVLSNRSGNQIKELGPNGVFKNVDCLNGTAKRP
jgi:hypothetical protein